MKSGGPAPTPAGALLAVNNTPASRLPSSECLNVRIPQSLPPGPSEQPAAPQHQHQSGTSRAGFSLNGDAEDADASPRAAAAAAQQEAPAQSAQPAPQPPGVATAAPALPPPPAAGGDDDMKTAEAAAATKIQAGFRGYKVRRQLREQSQDLSGKEADSGSGGSGGAASEHSQPPPPGQQCRGGGGRHHRGSMEAEAALEAALDEELMQRSAARIQAGVRGFLVRRRQQNAALAAAKIQAGFRGYRTRRELKQRDHRIRDLRDHRGGGKVQMPVRQAAQ